MHWAGRRPADVLEAGGLHDVAAYLSVPWEATTGQHPADEFAQRGVSRRIDFIYATEHLLPTLREYEVIGTDQARRASDHLPVVVTFDPQ